MIQIFSADGRTDQPKVVQEVLADLKSLQIKPPKSSFNIVNGITDTGIEYFTFHQTFAKKKAKKTDS